MIEGNKKKNKVTTKIISAVTCEHCGKPGCYKYIFLLRYIDKSKVVVFMNYSKGCLGSGIVK